jgi:o-succinylbenzoate synthase
VRISAVRLHAYRLPLRTPWASAAGRFGLRTGWLVRIETSDGRAGFGDCAPLAGTGTETPEHARQALFDWAETARGMGLGEASSRLGMASTPAARCAIECALLDLAAQSEGQPLCSLLGGKDGAADLRVNAAIGTLNAALHARADTAERDGFAVLKVKVGVEPHDCELKRIQALSFSLAPHVQLRLDANQAWDESTAAQFIDGCAGLPVEAIEEPLAGADRHGLGRLQAICDFPLAVDESWSADEVESFMADPPVRRLILKPPRLGGLSAAVSLGRRAAASGVECVVTSSVDCACGIFAAAQVAAALENGLAHGLATSSWLAADVGLPPGIIRGQMTLPAAPGLGFVPECAIDFRQRLPLLHHPAAESPQ